jgi:hypothetical protein
MTTIPPMIRARVDGIPGPRRALSDGQGGERYVTNVSRRGYCFVAPVGCAASPYIQHLYGRGDLSCQRINTFSDWRQV